MATAANKKTASSKTTATKTAATKTTGKGFAAEKTGGHPRKAAATKAPAKRKDALTVLADATTAAKKPAAKKATHNASMQPMRTAKNLKQLRAVLDEFPKAVKFSTSAKVADTILLLNVRGKPIAEVTLADKK